MKKNISVIAIPVDEHRTANPYNYLLHAGLKEQGLAVRNYRLKRLLQAGRFDVVHLHHPEHFLSGKTALGAYKKLITFWLKMVWLKMRGKKLVWTVHNLFPFKATRPALTKLFYHLLLRYTDGYIAPTKQGAGELAKLGIPVQKTTVIPYPHCGGHYPNSVSKKEAREKLGIPPDTFVFLFAGHIRNHKNLVELIKAFHQMNDKEATLVIAGKIHFDVSSELEQWIQDDANILVFPQFIEDEDLQFFFNSADLVVMPDHKKHGFGTALLNLSFGKPTLLSKTENFLELQQQVGEKWIKMFSGQLMADHLKKSKAEVESQPAGQRPDLAFFDKGRIAIATKSFYEAVLAGRKLVKADTKKERRPLAMPIRESKPVAALRSNPASR